MIVTIIVSAASGEESGTVLTLAKDPVEEHFHSSENNQEINEELQWKNMIFDLFEQLRVANNQDEPSDFEEDIS